ncbi:MAG: manganese catalase family protein [Oscillospiraceae bacterium]|nr:manganese catalase family protein [Oscillospiraceae bacterium]
MIGCIVRQLTEGEGAKSFDKWGRGDYYTDHANAIFPASAGGVPWSAAGIQSKGDTIADIMENMAAEGASG